MDALFILQTCDHVDEFNQTDYADTDVMYGSIVILRAKGYKANFEYAFDRGTRLCTKPTDALFSAGKQSCVSKHTKPTDALLLQLLLQQLRFNQWQAENVRLIGQPLYKDCYDFDDDHDYNSILSQSQTHTITTMGRIIGML